MTTDKQPFVVTTAHKGVFFGYAKPTSESTIKLERARMCVYWSTEVKGVLGLAANGPTQNCRIGPAVTSLILRDVTAVIAVSSEAAKQWEKEIWS